MYGDDRSGSNWLGAPKSGLWSHEMSWEKWEMVARARSERFLQRPITSLQLALIIVAVASIGAIGWRDATANRALPLISAPLMPPWWLVYVFSGGPHSSIGPYEEAQATFACSGPFLVGNHRCVSCRLVMAPTESGCACTLSTLRSPRCAAARLEGTLRNFIRHPNCDVPRRALILQALVQGFDAQIDLLSQCRRCLSAPLTEESPLSPVRSGPLRRDTIEHRWHDVRAPEESLRPCIREDFR